MSMSARSGNSPLNVPPVTLSSHAQAALPSANDSGFSPHTLIITATTLRISLSSSTSNHVTVSSRPTRLFAADSLNPLRLTPYYQRLRSNTTRQFVALEEMLIGVSEISP